MPKDDKNELFIVVDKDDKILGYRTRYDCHHDNKLIHRGVGIVIYNAKGEILLQKRSITKDTDPGLYDISAGGHVSKGQTYREAADRELWEEIGIKTKIKLAKKFLFHEDNETEMEVVYVGVHDGPFKVDKNEVDEVGFFKVNEIKKILDKLSPYAIESLKQLNIL